MPRAREVRKSFAVEEIIRCAKNPIYFIDNYCKIQHPKRGLIDFKTHGYQKDTVKAFLAKKKVIINKPRQMGYTTLVSAYITWFMLFHNDKSVIVLSKDHRASKNVIRKIKLILAKLPAWMYLADITKNREHTLIFSNGSSVVSLATTAAAGRSDSASLVVVDEAAFVRGLDEIWGSLTFTNALGDKLFVLSTPKGIGNFFYTLYKGATEGENEFYPMTVNWWDNPEYAEGLQKDPKVPGGHTSPWFKSITSDKTVDQVREELLTSFVESGDNFVKVDTINVLQNRIRDPIEKRFCEITQDENMWIWNYPKEEGKYIVSGDVGMGSGTDHCASTVLDLNTCEVVAEYKSKIPPDLFADYLLWVGEMYNDAYIVSENNGYGLATAMGLKNSDYKNIVYLEAKTNKLIDKWFADYKAIPPGINMSPAIRPAVLAKLKEFLENDYVIVKSQRLVNELLTFIIEGGKPQAAKGFNDDLIMALAIALWVRDVCPAFGQSRIDSQDLLSLYDKPLVKRTDTAQGRIAMPTAGRMKQMHKKTSEVQREMRVGNIVIDLTGLMKGN